MTRHAWCPALRAPDAWLRDVRITVDDSGLIAALEPDAAPGDAVRLPGPVVPGLPNAHSHAFQYAMAGLAERASGGPDSFWSWREAMYGLVERLTPAHVEAIAAQLYVTLLEAGCTSVAEFHYVHHQPDGTPYDDPAELGARVQAAAATAGIGLTLLPVLYRHGGVGGRPATPRQRRFLADVPWLLEQVRRLAGSAAPTDRVGLALHSLRAVTPDELHDAVAALDRLDPTAPVHLHIAEQLAEVEDCLRVLGARPVAWLADHVPLSGRWSLVHATHALPPELDAVAPTGAIAVICPTTEANLGDGVFPGAGWWDRGGAWAIGSDSHVVTDPAEELRALEGAQRLVHQRRLVLRDPRTPHVGAGLVLGAAEGGARALGRPAGRLEPGRLADWVVLDAAHPRLEGREGDALLDTWALAGGRELVREVWVAGRRVVHDGRHPGRERARAAYRAAVRALVG